MAEGEVGSMISFVGTNPGWVGGADRQARQQKGSRAAHSARHMSGP